MKIAIVGSREYPDRQQVVDYVNSLPEGTIVISGEAGGVDRWARDAALARGLTYEPYPADWDHLGKAAGFIRNQEMVEAADQVVVFWDRRSRGAYHTLELARKAGKLRDSFFSGDLPLL